MGGPVRAGTVGEWAGARRGGRDDGATARAAALGAMGANGAAAGGAGDEAEDPAERVEDAGGGGNLGEQLGGGGLGEHGFQLRGIGGDFVAEEAEQPAMAAGEPGAAGGGLRRRAARGAAAEGAGERRAAGGEARHQALEALAGVADAVAERQDEGDEAGLAEEAAGDEVMSGTMMRTSSAARAGAEAWTGAGMVGAAMNRFLAWREGRAQGNSLRGMAAGGG